MSTLLAGIVVFAAFGAVMAGLVLLTRRQRGRKVGGSIAGPFEEIWHPSAHRARIEIQIQGERKIPMPSPGEPPLDADPATRRPSDPAPTTSLPTARP
ncbi:hypothetical protein ACVBEQ_01565 [Nakamurella sp. GG22]